MRLYVAVTDYDWYKLHCSKLGLEDVNFWKPSPKASFRVLQVGEPLLFKLHSPRNFVVGGGFFVRFLKLPVRLAWEAFGEANGARTLSEVKTRIAKYRKIIVGAHDDPEIGCVILAEPFFFPEQEWIPCPRSFAPNIQTGKGYDTDEPEGSRLWLQVSERLARMRLSISDPGPALVAATEEARYGRPAIVEPRLGQGSFRVLVTEAYSRHCAMTGERTLPVLEAAHIRPYADGGKHELTNGLLLRSDLHKLFDQGYVTVDPEDYRVVVSRRIREEYENGRDYYKLHGSRIYVPANPAEIPSREHLRYHAEVRFH